MDKKKMMQGIVGCRLRAMAGDRNTTTGKKEEIAYTNQDQIITAEEESLKQCGIMKEKNGKSIEDCLMQQSQNG